MTATMTRGTLSEVEAFVGRRMALTVLFAATARARELPVDAFELATLQEELALGRVALSSKAQLGTVRIEVIGQSAEYDGAITDQLENVGND